MLKVKISSGNQIIFTLEEPYPLVRDYYSQRPRQLHWPSAWVGGDNHTLEGQPGEQLVNEKAHAQMTHLGLWLSVVTTLARCKTPWATTGISWIKSQGHCQQNQLESKLGARDEFNHRAGGSSPRPTPQGRRCSTPLNREECWLTFSIRVRRRFLLNKMRQLLFLSFYPLPF